MWRTMKMVAIMAVMILFGATPVMAQDAGEDQYEEVPAEPTVEVVTGFASDVSESGMRVGDPEDPACAYQLSFAEAGTEFFARRGGEDVPITISEINDGDFVEFTFTLEANEVVPDICPPPVISPDTVVLLEDNTPAPDEPGDEPGDGSGDGPGDEPGDEPNDTPQSPSNDEDVSGKAGSADRGSGSAGGNAGNKVGFTGVLPDTGGASLLTAMAGLLLVSSGGLLAYRKFYG